MILPARDGDTDLGQKRLPDKAPPVGGFIDAMVKARPDELRPTFDRTNLPA